MTRESFFFLTSPPSICYTRGWKTTETQRSRPSQEKRSGSYRTQTRPPFNHQIREQASAPRRHDRPTDRDWDFSKRFKTSVYVVSISDKCVWKKRRERERDWIHTPKTFHALRKTMLLSTGKLRAFRTWTRAFLSLEARGYYERCALIGCSHWKWQAPGYKL